MLSYSPAQRSYIESLRLCVENSIVENGASCSFSLKINRAANKLAFTSEKSLLSIIIRFLLAAAKLHKNLIFLISLHMFYDDNLMFIKNAFW